MFLSDALTPSPAARGGLFIAHYPLGSCPVLAFEPGSLQAQGEDLWLEGTGEQDDEATHLDDDMGDIADPDAAEDVPELDVQKPGRI